MSVAVIVHGFGGDTLEVEYLRGYLEKRGITVETILLSGHGGSKRALALSKHGEWTESADSALLQIQHEILLAARC
ncbi:hypothetical protein FACS18949_10650 [Clostridia bacterium]|nr:hypothetical protein FACS18949_10650 [Clostridia bacterium]